MIRKTSLLHKIGPMMRRSSFTKKIILQLDHLARGKTTKRRKRPGDYARFSRPHVLRHDFAIPSSDRSPLYDVRNHACRSIRREAMRNSLLFADIRRTHSGRLRSNQSRSTITSNQTSGGGRRDRTDDLMLAKHALSQLSYGPIICLWPAGQTRKLARRAVALAALRADRKPHKSSTRCRRHRKADRLPRIFFALAKAADAAAGD